MNNISPYDNIPVSGGNPESDNSAGQDQLQYVDVPVENIAPENAGTSPEVTIPDPADHYDTADAAGASSRRDELRAAGAVHQESASPVSSSIQTADTEPESAPAPAPAVTGDLRENTSPASVASGTGPQHGSIPVPPEIPAVSAAARPAAASPADTTVFIPAASLSNDSTTTLKNLDGIREYTLPFEETLLVPDTMPDIGEIMFSEGAFHPDQSSRTAAGNTGTVSGEIVLHTAYSPAETTSSPVDVIRSAVSFRSEIPDIQHDAATGTSAESVCTFDIGPVTAELMNERKFTVKGYVKVRVTVVTAKELPLHNANSDPDLILKNEQFSASELIFEATETTEISQEINLHEDQPEPVKILKESFSIVENHRQITSGKLVINGTILSEILYLGLEDHENTLCCLRNKTDFTQFIMADNDLDSDLIEISFAGDDLKASVETRSQIMITGTVTSSVHGYRTRSIPVISDAYHKKNDIRFDMCSRPLSCIAGTVSGELSSREVVNIDEEKGRPEKLLCATGTITELCGTAGQGRIVLEGSIPVKILALDSDGNPFVIESTVPLRGTLDMPALENSPDTTEIAISASIKDLWFDSINSRQLEINISVSIEIWAIRHCVFHTIENLCISESASSVRTPSIALYVTGPDDTLWDIAKRYRTDTESIAAVNDLDAGQPLSAGTRLLVVR